MRADRPVSVDHDLVTLLGLAQRLEVDLELHADLEVVGPAEQDRLHPRALFQVDLADAVAGNVGVLLPEQRHVTVRPGPEPPAGRQLDVLAAFVEALRAHQPPREEDLAAVRAPAAEQAWQLLGVVGDPEEPLLDRYPCHLAARPPSAQMLRSRPTQYGSRSVRL